MSQQRPATPSSFILKCRLASFCKKPSKSEHLQLALESLAVVLLEQCRTVGVRVDSDAVEGVELRGPVEHVLVDLAVVSSERGIELPVREVPCINQTHGMRSDVCEQLHDGASAGELDLADSDCGRSVEFRSLLLEGV